MTENFFEKIGLKPIINASGRMTALGVSTMSDGVSKAVMNGGKNYVVMDSLFEKTGEILSTYTGAEASLITSSASAGIAISIAAIIAKDNLKLIRELPYSVGLKNEIIIPKGHIVGFGAPVPTMVRIGGGQVVEAGLVNEVTKQDILNEINDNTAGILYVKSHHTVQKGMISIEELIEVSQEYKLPLIVDAAAEEDLKKYIDLGSDLVIYSGAKAFEGPTSGFITGKRELISYCFMQYQGIGRPMKIGKEGIAGLLKALELYERKDNKKIVKEMINKVQKIKENIEHNDSIEVKVIKDEAGREIYRVELKILNGNAYEVEEELRSGYPSIYTRTHRLSENIINLDVRSVTDREVNQIIERINDIFTGGQL